MGYFEELWDLPLQELAMRAAARDLTDDGDINTRLEAARRVFEARTQLDAAQTIAGAASDANDAALTAANAARWTMYGTWALFIATAILVWATLQLASP